MGWARACLHPEPRRATRGSECNTDSPGISLGTKRPHPRMRPLHFQKLSLHIERRTAAAGALHIRVLELESRALERLNVIYDAPIQVHDRGRIDVDLKAVKIKGLIHHACAVFELHGVGEPGTTAAHDTYAQTGGDWIL